MEVTGSSIEHEVKARVRDFIIDNFLFGNNTVEFSDHDSFMENGIIDSTGILELIGFLEETYGLKVEDDELTPENLDSLQRVGAFIRMKQSAS